MDEFSKEDASNVETGLSQNSDESTEEILSDSCLFTSLEYDDDDDDLLNLRASSSSSSSSPTVSPSMHRKAPPSACTAGGGEVSEWVQQLLRRDPLTLKQVRRLCQQAQAVLVQEKNLVEVSSPVTVCGDIHGQFYDLLELFKVAGQPPDTNFLFMGDYVDRGLYSVAVISLLLSLKVQHPQRITLLRGNHESRMTTQVYGFYDECMATYNTSEAWRLFTDTFDFLPLAARVDGRTLCMHGGLSPSISTLDDIAILDRFQEAPHDGAMSDLLWSDPEEDSRATGWRHSARGAGFLWAEDVSQHFMHNNQLDAISRAHQLVDEGYSWCHGGKVVTVFTAPNYCYRSGNLAAYMRLQDSSMDCHTFEAAPREQSWTTSRRFKLTFF